MDQKLIIAIILSMGVIFGYYYIFPLPSLDKKSPVESASSTSPQSTNQKPERSSPAAESAETQSALTQSVATETTGSAKPEPNLEAAKLIRVITPRYSAQFDTKGAKLVSLKLNDYYTGKKFTDWGDLIPFLRNYLDKDEVIEGEMVEMVKRQLNDSEPFSVEFIGNDSLTQEFKRIVFSADKESIRSINESASPISLTFTASAADGITVTKEFTFHLDSYIIDYKMQVINYRGEDVNLRVMNIFGEGPLTEKGDESVRSFYGPIFREDGSVDTEDPDGIEEKLIIREPDWMGITSNYFIVAVSPESRIKFGEYRSADISSTSEDEKWVAYYGMELPVVDLKPKKMVTSRFQTYFGPKKISEMEKFGKKLDESLDLTLEILASPLLVMLRWFHGFVGNYGIAIILLTIVVRTALFPLTYKGMVSMKRMQKLQPKIKAMREKYKGNKTKINQEMMGMYKRYKVNPLGGCLPIAFQIPVFFALYSALLGAIELRHSPFFLWIEDLSAMDPLYITPVLMSGTMFIQQRLTPSSMDPMQQKIMMYLPIIFMFFMITFPSGLVLYWVTSNLLSILQQIIINRVHIPDLVEPETG